MRRNNNNPISEGGCGFADPTSQRMTSFPANLVNCLPLLLTNPVIRHWVTQTSRWPTSATHVHFCAGASMCPRWYKRGLEPPKRGLERGALQGTLRANAVVSSTSRPVYHQPVSRGQPSGLQTPTVPLKITNEIDFGPIWGPFKVPRQRCGPMGCALGHRSSSVRRTGTIYGGPDTSHELPFDTSHQRGHQVKSY